MVLILKYYLKSSRSWCNPSTIIWIILIRNYWPHPNLISFSVLLWYIIILYIIYIIINIYIYKHTIEKYNFHSNSLFCHNATISVPITCYFITPGINKSVLCNKTALHQYTWIALLPQNLRPETFPRLIKCP